MKLLLITHALGNSDDTTPPEGELTPMDNAAVGEVATGNKLFLPYGEYPHNNGILQKFDRDSAQTMADVLHGQQSNNKLTWLANVFKVGWHRVSKTSLPVYAGKHPETDPSADPAAYGWLKKIVPLDNGAEFEVEWSAEGQDLIKQRKFRYFSPFWQTAGDGKQKTPVIMESLCLTNRPRIPAAGLGNAADPNEAKEDPKKEGTAADPDAAKEAEEADHATEADKPQEDSALTLITKALNLPEGSPIKDILMKIEELANKVAGFEQHVEARINEAVKQANAEKDQAMTAAGNTAEQLSQAVASHENAIAAEQAKAAITAAELALAREEVKNLTSLANTFKGLLADEHLAKAQREGQVTPAMLTEQRDALIACGNDADFAAAVDKLHKLPVVMKTTQGHTAHAAGGGKLMGLDNSAEDRRALIRTAVEQYKAELPATFTDAAKHDLAWQRLRKERPDLIGG